METKDLWTPERRDQERRIRAAETRLGLLCHYSHRLELADRMAEWIETIIPLLELDGFKCGQGRAAVTGYRDSAQPGWGVVEKGSRG